MNEETRRFNDRFQASFSEGLENVKFFVVNTGDVSFADLVKDVNKINDTIAAGEFRVVDSIDKGFETRRFDDAF